MTSAATISTQQKAGYFYAFIGVLMLLTIHICSLPLVESQVIPISTIIALIITPFLLKSIQKSPMLLAVSVFVLLAVVHSLIALIIDVLLYSRDTLRFFSWVRQFAALLLGFNLFLAFRLAFVHLSNRSIAKYILIGTVPALALAVLNIYWGVSGNPTAGAIVDGVRWFIARGSYSSPFRVSGLSTEPSTFAATLVVIVMPMLLWHYDFAKHKIWILAFIIISILCFAATFSTIGVLLILSFTSAGIFLGPQRKRLLGLFITMALFVIPILIIIPNNQILRHAKSLLAGTTNISFSDRFYGTFGPMLRSTSSLTLIGYGLGGSTLHFEEVVPKDVVSEIEEVKWQELPNLSTLIGRTFADTGLVGFVLFLFILFVGYLEVRRLISNTSDSADKSFLQYVRLGFIAVIVSISTAFGSFHIPYLWIWLALIDARYLQSFDTSFLPLPR